MKCPRCKSVKTIKAAKTIQRVPKQRWFCKSCTRFFVSEVIKQ